jgi:class I fructose-bisphosphate aldolase
MSDRVAEILSWYEADNPGALAKLHRLLHSGALAGTGKLLVLPVDQGFEHGPAASFAPNPAGYDPGYHLDLALEAGFSAYACPLGFMEAVARRAAGRIPLILKLNSHESLHPEPGSTPALTATVDDALRLGCDLVGFTIYPGSDGAHGAYEELAEVAAEAKARGLAVVVWSYPRGEGLSKEAETAVDVVAYAVQIAAQLGAHVIKVKPPTGAFSDQKMRSYYQEHGIATETLEQRVRHCVDAAFAGRRIVIFSGGSKATEDEFIAMCREIAAGGGFGSIMGRNTFQRSREQALELVRRVAHAYREA